MKPTEIARLITEDPDVLSEVDASLDTSNVQVPSMDNSAIDSTDQPIDDELDDNDEQEKGLKDDLKAQQEVVDKAMERQRDTIRPEVDDLEKEFSDLNTDALQSFEFLRSGNEQLKGLDKQFATVQQMLANVQGSLKEGVGYDDLEDESTETGDVCCVCDKTSLETYRCDACRDNRMCRDCVKYEPSGQLTCCPRCAKYTPWLPW